MKLTRSQEAEIKKAMNAYWNSYLKGDLTRWMSFLSDNYRNIGTTEEEIWKSKQETVDYTKRVAHQIVGKAKIKNKQFQIVPYNPYVMVLELGDMYVKVGNRWSFYAKVRLSSLLEKSKKGWKILHQHGSYPDSKTMQGETIAFDVLKAEHAKLQQAVKERTLELEQKNKELEIEAALERIRSASLAMYRTEELKNVINEVFKQLRSLGISLDACYIDIFRENSSALHLWVGTTSGTGRYSEQITIPYLRHPLFDRVKKARQNKESFYTIEVGRQSKDRFVNYMASIITIPRKRKQIMLDAKGLKMSTAVTKYASLSAYNYQDILYTPKENEIILRVAHVFEQAYTRFLDLKKAEAQAEEAKIEAALEKVRSRSLAMHKAEELGEVITLLVEKLGELNIPVHDGVAIITYIEGSNDLIEWMGNPGFSSANKFYVPYFDHPVLSDLWKAKKEGLDFIAPRYTAKENKSFLNHIFKFSDYKDISQDIKNYCLSARAYSYSIAFHKYSSIFINDYSGNSLSERQIDILKRFSKVFEQAYIRFLDLQRAEAQTREAQVEVALERTRTQSMLMQRSEELNSTATVFHEQLCLLGIDSEFSYLWLPDEENENHLFWAAWDEKKNGKTIINNKAVIYPLDKSESSIAACYAAWESGDPIHVNPVLPSNIETYFATWSELLGDIEKFRPEHFKKGLYYIDAYMKYGCFGIVVRKQLTDDEKKILNRFTIEFERTYTRFLDLKKAEEQAREAQIETALERIRAKVTAMQDSSDLLDIVVSMRSEFVALGHEAGYFWYMRWQAEKYEKAMTSGDGARIGMVMELPRHIHGSIKILADWEKSNEPAVVYAMSVDEAVDYVDKMIKLGDFKQVDPNAPTLDDIRHIGGLTFVMARTTDGEIGYSLAGTVLYPPAEDVATLVRFAAVFDLAYRRFEDLKLKEQQTRDALIELALEKVRSRTMAMQKSDELGEVATVLFKELNSVVVNLWTCGFVLCEKDRAEDEWWLSTERGFIPAFYLPNVGDRVHENLYKAWKDGESYHTEQIEGKELEQHYDWLMNFSTTKKIFDDFVAAGYEKPTWQKLHAACFSKGYLCITTRESCPDEDVFKRFAHVFDLAYTRFLDLQKAEANAKETQIEAGLEKVRAMAMAMHNSNDLSVTASMVFTELRKLGINPIRCGVGLPTKESRKAQLYSASSTAIGDSLFLIGWVQLENHPVLKKIYDSWEEQHDYFPELQGDELQSYYKVLLEGFPVPVPDFSRDQKHYGHFLTFSIGCLYAWSDVKYNESEIKILKRFTGIVDLTFRRYFELQQSEAIAREAVKQAALDRIRADIASMRTVEDLQRITPVIWNELTILNVQFIRCGIFIMDDNIRQIHTFLSTPTGSAIVSFHLPYDNSTNILDVVNHWHHNKLYMAHWGNQEFASLADSLVEQKAITTREQYLQSLPDEGIYLHLIPFMQGMLYVGNLTPLSTDDLNLLQSVADAFSTAYARYEDFNKLEAAKQQVEHTLTELRQAQNQLIQSEKMASLGELTAGIAHEIQNPLNFVNNFSEVSAELLEEMKEEIAKGNVEDTMTIVEDLKQNLEKISHHGKRADGIVKGMLQHSRSGRGQKELTDINIMADEYLRLAFHGFRAKDNSFNAKFETEFDNSLGKIKIIAQDFSRVILNLINNAFYAVNEKAKQNIPGYKPMVLVTTKKEEGKVIIVVRDNGTGIPPHVLDKIFQPFFTTKPTGLGTGLGLSLSYDIVSKGHGGELKVETQTGEFTRFIITIPYTGE